ncbi:MAG: stage III sporulation protein AB [Clostridia bacterium]|nr:stage III sporulation protein AB [Clostridia bacterium]
MRLAGAFVMFLFFTLLGIYAGGREKKRLAECEAFLALFEYIKNQIIFFLTPTKVIYGSFSNDVLEACGFLPALRSHENDAVYHGIWQSALNSSAGALHLTEKQRELVADFGDCIGKTNGEIQANSFDYYIAELKSEIEREKSEGAKNVKLYRTLGLAAGACAAILII